MAMPDGIHLCAYGDKYEVKERRNHKYNESSKSITQTKNPDYFKNKAN